jgi:dihydroorotate dehydrogenase electron transfer subunit
VLELLPAREYPRPVTVDARVLANRHLSDRYWQLSLAVPHIAGSFEPGQFVMITVTRSVSEGPVLPRPMAIYDADRATGRIEIVYSVVGVGTRALTTFGVGDTVGVVGPLGRGFHPPAGDVLLLGRGIGICSLTPLAALANDDAVVTAVASGRHPGAILGREVYQAHGVRLLAVHDADGSSAPDRLATRLQDLLDTAPPALIAACGSARLEALALRLAARWGSDVQVALEAHMACGLGYCHGCSTGDRSAAAEAPLICRDGPVFRLRTSPAQPAPCLNS